MNLSLLWPWTVNLLLKQTKEDRLTYWPLYNNIMFSFVAGFCMLFLTWGGGGLQGGLICNELLLGP